MNVGGKEKEMESVNTNDDNAISQSENQAYGFLQPQNHGANLNNKHGENHGANSKNKHGENLSANLNNKHGENHGANSKNKHGDNL